MFEWITAFVEQDGYWGIALLMLAENVFPPIPSELIMPLAGFVAARGELNAALLGLEPLDPCWAHCSGIIRDDALGSTDWRRSYLAMGNG